MIEKKVRVYELAKELGIPSKEILQKAQSLGIPIKGNFNALSDSEILRVRRAIGGPVAPPPSKPRPTPKPPQGEPGSGPPGDRTGGIQSPRKVSSPRRIGPPSGIQSPRRIDVPPGVQSPRRIDVPPGVKSPRRIHVPPGVQSPRRMDGPPGGGPPRRPNVPPREPQPPRRPGPPSGPQGQRSAPPARSPRPGPPSPSGPPRGRDAGRPHTAGPKPGGPPRAPATAAPRKSGGGRRDRRRPETGVWRERGREEREVLFAPGPASAPKNLRPTGKKRIDFRRSRRGTAEAAPPPPPPTGPVSVATPVSMRDLSAALGLRVQDILGNLLGQGFKVHINSMLDEDAVLTIAAELSREVLIRAADSLEQDAQAELDLDAEQGSPEDAVPRAPVVTLMGHVDHGKTTLLDRIRHTNVVADESGGITQHIAAYRVQVADRSIVFIDTPGHRAFTSMRARGANVTDIVVLVVAADDGVMPQTEEAINHVAAAKVRKTIVAINKIDKPGINTQAIRATLAQKGVIPDDWGGDTVFIEVSALSGQGVDDLLDMIVTEAELLELRANPKLRARGTVIEAKVESGRGPTATVLIQEGTLRRGASVVCGTHWGRVRAMLDDRGREIPEAGPSTPIVVLGLSGVPQAGDQIFEAKDPKQAKALTERRQVAARGNRLASRGQITLESLFDQMEEGAPGDVRLIIKTDVQGSAEVLRDSLERLSTDEVKVRILHAMVGPVNESDVDLADASQGIILTFHVGIEPSARVRAREKKVDVRHYTVIYELVDDVRAAMEGLLKPEEVEVLTGHLEVKEIFAIHKMGHIAGCIVTDGKVESTSRVRVRRGGEVIHQGRLDSLRRFKQSVKEVTQGLECGLHIGGFEKVAVGDILEAFRIEIRSRKLSPAGG